MLIKGSATVGGQTAARYSSGYVFFINGDTLLGQAFDTERLELMGQPFLVEGGSGDRAQAEAPLPYQILARWLMPERSLNQAGLAGSIGPGTSRVQ